MPAYHKAKLPLLSSLPSLWAAFAVCFYARLDLYVFNAELTSQLYVADFAPGEDSDERYQY